MDIIITGKGGQLAHACQLVLDSAKSLSINELDITDEASVAKLDITSETVVINTAAFTNTEAAEENPTEAFRINALGPLYLSRKVAASNATLVQISTDYVFDGVEGNYTEESAVHPINVYGLSKYAGEQLVRNYCEKYYILRTSCLFGPTPDGNDNNFVSKRLQQLKQGAEITMVDDQYTVPTFTVSFARALQEILTANIPYGTYHLVGSGGGVTWYEFTREIMELSGYTSSITAVKTNETIQKMPRPRNCILVSSKLPSYKIALPAWHSDLRQYLSSVRL